MVLRGVADSNLEAEKLWLSKEKAAEHLIWQSHSVRPVVLLRRMKDETRQVWEELNLS